MFSLPGCQPKFDDWMFAWWYPCGFRQHFNPVMTGDLGWLMAGLQRVHREHHAHARDLEDWGIAFNTRTRTVYCSCNDEFPNEI